MSVLLLLKILAGLAIFLVGFALLAVSSVVIAYIRWKCEKKSKEFGDWFGETTKGSSKTRQRMEELRKQHQAKKEAAPPLSKRERILYRNLKNKWNRQVFLGRLASRKR